jgi:glycosyltransferase involved in cell wall biosynthesis
MKLAVFPPPGGGLGTLRASGQLLRLARYYLPAYAEAFDEVRYFSYLDEGLPAEIADTLGERVRLVPNRPRQPHRLYTFTLADRQARWLAPCAVSRVLQAPGVLPAWRARQRWGIPLAVTYGYHYAAFARGERRWLAWLYTTWLTRLALRVADAVIVTTAELADYAARRVTRARVHLIPNGVDVARFAPGEQGPDSAGGAGRPAGGPVLFVGRLTHQKNLRALLEAAAEVQRELALRLEFAGDGPLRADLADAAGRLGLAVHFHGTLPQEELPALYRRARVFVLPSHWEGHPKALLEAMACGLPVIVSDVPGSREVVRDGLDGLVFPPGDVGALARRLRAVLTDPALAQRLGRAARRSAEERYNLSARLRQEITVLRDLAIESGR